MERDHRDAKRCAIPLQARVRYHQDGRGRQNKWPVAHYPPRRADVREWSSLAARRFSTSTGPHWKPPSPEERDWGASHGVALHRGIGDNKAPGVKPMLWENCCARTPD